MSPSPSPWRDQPPTHLLRRTVDDAPPPCGEGVSWCGVSERECKRVTTLAPYATCGECVRLYKLANDLTTNGGQS